MWYYKQAPLRGLEKSAWKIEKTFKKALDKREKMRYNNQALESACTL